MHVYVKANLLVECDRHACQIGYKRARKLYLVLLTTNRLAVCIVALGHLLVMLQSGKVGCTYSALSLLFIDTVLTTVTKFLLIN